MEIHVEGVESVIAAIRGKFGNAEGKLSKGIAKGCKIVEGAAKHLCPKSTDKTRPPIRGVKQPHGELRASITSEVSGTTGAVGTNKEYAAYVELGTCKMAAQPYLQPALANKKGEVVEAIKAAMK